MLSTMIRTKYDEEMNELSNMKKKFAPILKTEDTSDNVFFLQYLNHIHLLILIKIENIKIKY